jgi:glycerol-3-phosphate dehydrogenase
LAVKGNATLELSFLREIRRLYQNEMSDTGNDVFRMKTVLGLIDTMQPYFDKCNQPDMKKEFERDKAKIQKELDKLKKQ